jgi:RNA polymerase primary sigma factor
MTRYELFTPEQERQAFMDLERRWPLGPQRNELENPPPPEAQPLYEECLNRNLRLAAWTAFRYRRGMGRANELVDLLQEGAIGLMLGVRRYDVHRGHRFSTYAYQWVRQRISRYLDDTGKPVRVPVHLADGIRRAKRREEWYWHMYGMAPGPLEFHEDEDLAVLGKLPTVLHRPQRLPETQAQLDSWVSIGASDRQHFLVDGLAPIHERLLCHGLDTCLTATLSPREKLVIELRFGLNGYVAHTLEQTGNQFGLTRERIRQIEKHAINKLQRNTGMRVLDGPRRRSSKKPTTPKKPGTRKNRHTRNRSRHAARHH